MDALHACHYQPMHASKCMPVTVTLTLPQHSRAPIRPSSLGSKQHAPGVSRCKLQVSIAMASTEAEKKAAGANLEEELAKLPEKTPKAMAMEKVKKDLNFSDFLGSVPEDQAVAEAPRLTWKANVPPGLGRAEPSMARGRTRTSTSKEEVCEHVRAKSK
ncbi:unnamed protein product [Symbiodinium sp. CCMP2592]|nr:unnamed protein product [Symbiodinium sp. CCMP2592]